MDDLKDCPVCHGSGDDPHGSECQCFTEEERMVVSSVCCVNVDCQGCGGICCYCGGSGKEKDWKLGGPYPRDYVLDEEKG